MMKKETQNLVFTSATGTSGIEGMEQVMYWFEKHPNGYVIDNLINTRYVIGKILFEPIKNRQGMTLNHLKAQLQEIKKNPTTSSVRGFFMDVNTAYKEGQISEEERAELWREIKA